MVIQRKSKVTGQEFVEEMKQRILKRFPDAEFNVHRVNRKDLRLEVTADFDNLFDILDLTSDRATDILVDHDIWIMVQPLRRSEN